MDKIEKMMSKKDAIIFVGKQIPIKYIPSKIGGPLKERDILEGEKGKQVGTYAGVFSARRSTDWLTNGQGGRKF